MLLSALATGFSAPRTSSVTVGDVRVTAISPEVVRVEPKGPQGFEDRTTFMVVDRDMSKGLDITQKSTSDGTLLTTSHYSVLLKPKSPAPTCAAPSESKDVTDLGTGIRSDKYPDGLAAADRDACCAACEGDDSCIAWIHEEATALDSANCWPLKTFSGLKESSNRAFGCSAKRAARCASIASPLNFTVSDAAGALLYDSAAAAPAGTPPLNLLYWPSPMSAKAYALADFPRFFTPQWGAAPAPAGSAYAETNGYDFSNNVAGDTYVFALGSTLDDYATARKAFVDLVGGTPLLPDFAYGTWFTWWHSYTEAEARGDIARWANGSLPIDVWALDMNWRNTSDHGAPHSCGRSFAPLRSIVSTCSHRPPRCRLPLLRRRRLPSRRHRPRPPPRPCHPPLPPRLCPTHPSSRLRSFSAAQLSAWRCRPLPAAAPNTTRMHVFGMRVALGAARGARSGTVPRTAAPMEVVEAVASTRRVHKIIVPAIQKEETRKSGEVA